MSLTLAMSQVKTKLNGLTGITENTDKSVLQEGTLDVSSKISGAFDGTYVASIESVEPFPEARFKESWHICTLKIEVGKEIGKEGRTAAEIAIHQYALSMRQGLGFETVGANVKGVTFDGASGLVSKDGKRLIATQKFKMIFQEDPA